MILPNDNAFQAAKLAYNASPYGLVVVKLALAIEAYLSLPDREKLQDDVLAVLNATAQQNDQLISAFQFILALIGNVDHTKGNGENLALMRGEMLGDIRAISNAAIEETQ